MKIENNIPVTLTVKPERTLDMVAAEIRAFTAGMLNNAIEIGRRMVEAKAMLPYGQFGTWISENTGYSASAANNFMRLFDEYGAMQGSLFGASAESQTFGKLPPSKALALLAVPADEREAFAVESDAEHSSVRELKRKIDEYQRERDEAVRKLETVEGDLRDANHVNDRLRQDLDAAKNAPPDPLLLAAMREEERKDAEDKVSEKLAESEKTAAEAKEELMRAQEALNQAESEVKAAALREKQLKAELSDLQKANAANGQLMEETVRKSTEEATAAVKTELEKANAAKKAAEEQRKAAETELAAMRQRLTASAVDKDITAFEFLFNQAKENANKMRDILLKCRSKADGAATADRLARIMVALADAVKECAQ